MRKLILEEWISLDGYASDKNGKLNFFAPHVRTSYERSDRMKFRDSIDTILLGTNTYNQFVTLWPHRTAEDSILAPKMNTARKIVCTHSLSHAPWGKWDAAEIISGDAIPAISKLKSTPGGNIIVWGSISLAQQLMAANIIDEYHIHICPLFTGGGVQLFPHHQPPCTLTLINAVQYGPGITHLIYQKQ